MKPINLTIKQTKKLPAQQQIDAGAYWIIVINKDIKPASLKQLPYAEELMARRKTLGAEQDTDQPLLIDLPNTTNSRVSLVVTETSADQFSTLTLARKINASLKTYNPTTIGIAVHGFRSSRAEQITEAIVAAAATSTVPMPNYKSSEQTSSRLERLNIYGVVAKQAYKRTLAEAEGNGVTRYLSMLPPNVLTPTTYLKEIKDLAKQYGWKLTFIDEKKLKQKKAGAFLAVSQGSSKRDAGIVKLEYTPSSRKPKQKLSLVGKGLCYDTGGANLKPANYMFGMHEDMQGSAVALGTLIALTKMKVSFSIDCWLALAMNHIGPDAYIPNDIITASDGTTIEVVHTDAEGRMVLADTLVMASETKPDLIMDYATLTGACVYSLGTAYSGVFSNRESLNPKLIRAGKASGERVWPFPLDEDFDKAIESKIADVKQCSQETGHDHINAARFLQRFVKHDTPWVHVDLSASSRKGGLAHIPTDSTGFGVRYSVNLLLDKKIM
jgi:leucyl aminopeptidase